MSVITRVTLYVLLWISTFSAVAFTASGISETLVANFDATALEGREADSHDTIRPDPRAGRRRFGKTYLAVYRVSASMTLL